jgi:hypothetical protein
LPLEELESALGAQFKQAHESNAFMDCIDLKEKGLHISVSLEIANFQFPMVESADLSGDTTLLTKTYQVRAGTLIQTPWKT